MMKRILLSLLFVAFWATAHSQCTVAFSENFDGAVVNMTSTGTPGWVIDNTLQVSGSNSYRGRFSFGDSAILSTPSFSTLGNTSIILEFDHICKVNFFDRSQVEVSVDGGLTWIQLDTTHYVNDSAGAFMGSNSFSAIDYFEWDFGVPTATPTNSWWKHEIFDLSSVASEQADVIVRFNMYDFDNGFPNGMGGHYGWVLDNINICIAPCEQITPAIDMSANTLQNTIYNTGPFIANANIFDASGVVYTEVHVSTTGSAGPFTMQGNGTPGCPSLPIENYCFDIPAANVGDSVCFFIVAFDGSPCFNSDTTGLHCFLVGEGVSLTDCEDFDSDSVWTSNTVSGSGWEWGTPAFGTTNSAFSPPNAWDIDLDAGYVAGSQSFVTSPVYDFSAAVNPRLEFWINHSFDNGSTTTDGVQLQYNTTAPPGGTWVTLGNINDAAGTNWYNSGNVSAFANAGFANPDGWSGNSNGWKQAKFNLKDIAGIPNAAAVRFRFVFRSTNTGDGFSFDNFCAIQPPNYDPGIQAIITPQNGVGVSANAPIPVTVSLYNYGNAAMTSATVVCETSNGNTISNVWNGNLQPGQFVNFDVDTIIGDTATYDLCCFIDEPLNTDNSNDTVCHTLVIVPLITLSYCDDFESGNIGWTQQNSPVAATTTFWELGTPPGGAHSGTQAWDVNISTTGYDNDAECFLYTPYFDFSAAGSAIMNFWHNLDAENGWDGAHVEYTVDNGTTWIVLGSVGDVNGTNWYDDTSIPGPTSSTEGWSQFDGWRESSYKLCAVSDLSFQVNPVQFRFVFTSDGIITSGNGYTMDDFCILSSSTDDIGVSGIVAPYPSAPSGATVQVTVEVTNYGGTTINGFPVTYIDPNTSLPVTFNSTAVLPPCTTIVVTIPTGFTIPNTNFTLCAYTGLATDADHTNDTLCVPVVSVQTFTPSFCDGFDGTNYWYTETLGDPGTNWELGTPNNALGVTVGALSPPNAWDINLTSDYTAAANAILYSPYFDFATVTNATLKFWQNRAIGGFNDGFYIEYKEDVASSWTVLGTVNDTNAVNWYNLASLTNGTPGWNDYSSGVFGVPLWVESKYNLNSLSNSGRYQFRFHFVSGNFSSGDGVSIDSFCIAVPPPQDAGVIAILSPTGLASTNSTSNMRVTIKNFGSQAFSSTEIKWQQSTGGSGTFTWNGAQPLLPNQSITVNNVGTINSGAGPYDLCVWTELPSDGDNSNDTLCKPVNVVTGIPLTYLDPYFENFDTDGGWTATLDPTGNPATMWEFGVPAFGTTTGAHSAPTCWDINLFSAYTANAHTYLYSPFFDFSNAVDARLSFWHNFNTEDLWDGNNLQYTVDGTTWNVLGEEGDSCGLFAGVFTWYTDEEVNSSLQPGWEGSSGSWVRAYYDINCKYPELDNSGVVQFRFQFTSDGSFQDDGYSIDDFGIEIPIPVSISPQSVTAMCTSPQTLLLFPFAPTEFSVAIKNKGTTNASTCEATLVIDNNVIVTDQVTFNPSLAKDSVQNWVFSVQPVLAPGCHNVVIYTSNPNNTADQNPFDDTTMTTVCVFDTTTAWPYCNDFESGSEWVSLNALAYTSGDAWELGTPSQPFLNAAHSGSNAWTLKLNDDYPDMDTSGLFSPVMTVLANHCYRIGFYHQFRMEEFMDGGIVEYSTDLGQTWTTINFNQVYGNSDHYDYVTALSGLGNPVNGFTGNSDGWIYSEKLFRPGVTASMIVRWRFQSEYTRDDEGWTIDDVCFVDAGACNPLGIEEVTASGLGLGQNYPNPFNGHTTIEYTIPEKGNVQLVVTDAVGKVVSRIQNAEHNPGDYAVDFNSQVLKPGVYFYTLTFGNETITKRMMITE